ncbi:hypothetical protein [Xylella fastidiosa]|uniref:hypothetical protein n=1 Tax=Xylella fastidiosa TaxID=2371 RepID=UPI00177C0F8A|nr:hypothetical protein [Xylella fastidiosa]MBE0287355.1 hypothetical protein [Xylella fastidiosa subsp. fastidiosa]
MQRPFPERNRDAHGAGQRFPDHSKTPNHPITQLPNYPITQLPNYPITQLPNYPITQLPNYPITQLPNYPITQLPNYPTTQLPNYPTTQLPNYPSGKQQHSLSNATAGQGRAGQGRPYRAPLQLRASSAATVSTSRRCNTSSCLADLLRIIRDSLP